jgi:hypothetical protein
MTNDSHDPPIAAGLTGPGEYAPAGEAQGVNARFTADQVATALGVAADRVERAMAGELGLAATEPLDSRQVQLLAEVLLTDQPLAVREAALMELGAFTPRADQNWGLGEKAPGEESNPPIDPP